MKKVSLCNIFTDESLEELQDAIVIDGNYMDENDRAEVSRKFFEYVKSTFENEELTFEEFENDERFQIDIINMI